MSTPTSEVVQSVQDDSRALTEIYSFIQAHEERRGSSLPPTYRLSGSDLHDSIELTEQLHGVLKDVVRALSQGKSVSIVTHDQEVTTQEAAEILGLSRPTVVRLVDEGLIPALVPGKVRRKLKLTDVLAFQGGLHARRHRFITESSDAYHDEVSPADLDSLVDAARKSG